MYNKRIRVFIIFASALLVVCLLRLTQMQLLDNSSIQLRIARLKRQMGHSRQLGTIRGRIFDRNGNVLAADQPKFQLCINYRLSCFADQRVRQSKLLKATEEKLSEVGRFERSHLDEYASRCP